jgi:hypothetical protein
MASGRFLVALLPGSLQSKRPEQRAAMSYLLENLVTELRASDATPATSWALVNLASHADWRTGECWPTQVKQAEETGLHRQTIREAIVYAEAKGWLTRAVRSTRGTQTIYTYTFDPKLVANSYGGGASSSPRQPSRDESVAITRRLSRHDLTGESPQNTLREHTEGDTSVTTHSSRATNHMAERRGFAELARTPRQPPKPLPPPQPDPPQKTPVQMMRETREAREKTSTVAS